jgi:hypothetical protein
MLIHFRVHTTVSNAQYHPKERLVFQTELLRARLLLESYATKRQTVQERDDRGTMHCVGKDSDVLVRRSRETQSSAHKSLPENCLLSRAVRHFASRKRTGQCCDVTSD